MVTKREDIEASIKSKSATALTAIINKVGVTVDVYRLSAAELADEYTEAYGLPGNMTSTTVPVVSGLKVMFIGDTMTPLSPFNIGILEEGYILDPSNTINTGDEVVFTRVDGRDRRFKIMEPEALGNVDTVYTKYKISAVGKKEA